MSDIPSRRFQVESPDYAQELNVDRGVFRKIISLLNTTNEKDQADKFQVRLLSYPEWRKYNRVNGNPGKDDQRGPGLVIQWINYCRGVLYEYAVTADLKSRQEWDFIIEFLTLTDSMGDLRFDTTKSGAVLRDSRSRTAITKASSVRSSRPVTTSFEPTELMDSQPQQEREVSAQPRRRMRHTTSNATNQTKETVEANTGDMIDLAQTE